MYQVIRNRNLVKLQKKRALWTYDVGVLQVNKPVFMQTGSSSCFIWKIKFVTNTP